LTISPHNLYKKITSVTLCKFWHRTYTCLSPQHIQNPYQDHVWILHKHKSRYFTFQFFKQKLRLKSIYMLCTEHNKIGFAIFGFFCELLWNLQVTASFHKTRKNPLALSPRDFWTLTERSLDLALESLKEWNHYGCTLPPRGGLAGGDSRLDLGNKWHGVPSWSPAIDWWRRWGGSGLQRWPAARQWWRGRRSSNSSTMQARLGHPAHVEAWVGAREKLSVAGW
jgi:hypothetical protein